MTCQSSELRSVARYDGSAEALVKMLADASAVGIQERFPKALATRNFMTEDVGPGRWNVKAYVELVHCVEALPFNKIRTNEPNLIPSRPPL